MSVLTRILSDGTQIALCSRLDLADTFYSRLLGWLLRSHVTDQHALWIRPCRAVHTFGMRFSIDLLYLDQQQRTLAWQMNGKPWRMFHGPTGTVQVIELSAGFIQALTPSIQVGDRWILAKCPEERRD